MNREIIRDVGERELIRRFRKHITPCAGSLLKGDEDAVAFSLDGDALVVNTDMLVESTDILPGMTAMDVGWKAGVMGLSDLAAKGARPYGIVVSFGLPEETSEAYVSLLVASLNDVCRKHNTYYLGGDTNKCSELVISCTAIGSVPKDQLIRRNGAHPGDIVAVTGEFGYTGALFEILLGGHDTPQSILRVIRERALRPRARFSEGRALASSGVVSAAIDSSDGLAWSLHELAKASGVGFRIERIPIPPICRKFAEMHELDVHELALYGGEEFELVVTIPRRLWDNAVLAVERMGGRLLPIGRITKEKKGILVIDGEQRVVEAKGYEHFR